MLIKTKNIRNFLFRNKIYGYLITKNDEYFKSPDNLDLDVLRKLTNFTGSFGIAIITMTQNYLFVDGRYTTQAKKESGKKFRIIQTRAKTFGEKAHFDFFCWIQACLMQSKLSIKFICYMFQLM